MSSQTHHHSGTPADWLEDFGFLMILFSAVAVIATIVILMIVL